MTHLQFGNCLFDLFHLDLTEAFDLEKYLACCSVNGLEASAMLDDMHCKKHSPVLTVTV